MGEMSMRNFVNNWIIVFILCVIQHNYYMEKETKINEDSMQLKMVERWVESITRKIGRDHFAYLLLFLAAMMYPLCFVYVSKRDYHPVEANLVRGISIFVTHYFVLRWMGLDLDFKGSKNNKWLLVRSAAMLINQICYTVMHYVVPLPVINILNISGSLCVFILDYLLYGIPIHRGQVPGIIAGCLGVAFAASGEFLTALWDPTYTPSSDFGHYIVTDLGMRCIFGCLYVLASLVWAYGLVIQKQIKGVNGIKISYHSGVFFAFANAVAYPVVVTKPIETGQFLTGCCTYGVLMALVQILFTCAFNLTSNYGVLTMLTMLTLVPSYIVSIFSYHQKVNLIELSGLFLLAWGLKRMIQFGEVQAH